MPAKLYRQATVTSSATGSAISQPMANDSIRLRQDQVRMVCVLPHRSAICPPTMLPAILAAKVSAESRAPSRPRFAPSTPCRTSAAVRKAGIHAHRPSSSQLWNE